MEEGSDIPVDTGTHSIKDVEQAVTSDGHKLSNFFSTTSAGSSADGLLTFAKKMAKDERQDFRIYRPSAPLPSESDFDPFGGDLDAQSAWRNFGELSLKQAYDLFTTAPENYQEDFMFMGSAAFSYYFPVIDRYIREITGSDEGDDCEVAILGSAVVAQFDWKGATIGGHLLHEIEDLSVFVQANIQLYSPAEKDQRRIKREWMRVDSKVAEQKTRSEQDVDGNPH